MVIFWQFCLIMPPRAHSYYSSNFWCNLSFCLLFVLVLQLVSSLVIVEGRDRSIAVEGFYDDVRTVTKKEVELYEVYPYISDWNRCCFYAGLKPIIHAVCPL